MERRFTRPRARTQALAHPRARTNTRAHGQRSGAPVGAQRGSRRAEWLSQSMFVEELRRQFHAEHNEYIADLTAAIESAKDIHGKAIRSRPGTRGSHLRRVLQPCGSRSPKTRPNR
jgi:hypothetical protein